MSDYPGIHIDRAPGARCDAVFPGYTGKQRFRASHPSFRPLIVAAPDEASAIVAYAGALEVPWTRLDFYSSVTIEKF